MKYNLVLFILFAISNAYSQTDSIVVYFENNSSYLHPTEIEKLQFEENSPIMIHAYCDYLGSIEYNFWLSERRANRVKQIILRNGIGSNLIIESIGKGEIQSAQTNEIGIPFHRKVVISYSRTDFKIETETIIIEPEGKVIEEILEIDSIEVGEEINFPQLSFIGGKHELADNSVQVINQIIVLLNNNPNLKIAIEGHICCDTRFKDGYDQQTGLYNLSAARAKAVFDLLVNEGIDSTRLSYKGFGRTMPLYPLEQNEFEQQANRRVEFKLIEK